MVIDAPMIDEENYQLRNQSGNSVDPLITIKCKYKIYISGCNKFSKFSKFMKYSIKYNRLIIRKINNYGIIYIIQLLIST